MILYWFNATKSANQLSVSQLLAYFWSNGRLNGNVEILFCPKRVFLLLFGVRSQKIHYRLACPLCFSESLNIELYICTIFMGITIKYYKTDFFRFFVQMIDSITGSVSCPNCPGLIKNSTSQEYLYICSCLYCESSLVYEVATKSLPLCATNHKENTITVQSACIAIKLIISGIRSVVH